MADLLHWSTFEALLANGDPMRGAIQIPFECKQFFAPARSQRPTKAEFASILQKILWDDENGIGKFPN